MPHVSRPITGSGSNTCSAGALAGYETVAGYEDEANQLALIFAKIIVNKKANMQSRR